MATKPTETNPPAGTALLDQITPGKKKPEPHPLALLDPKAAAAFLGLSEWTLAEWRCKGTGPRFVKLGNRVRYTPAELAAWIEAHSGASTSEHDVRKAG